MGIGRVGARARRLEELHRAKHGATLQDDEPVRGGPVKKNVSTLLA